MGSDENRLIHYSVDKPGRVTAAMLVSTVLAIMLAVLPSIWPATFSMLNPLAVDTDPENMLSSEEPVRVFHQQMKQAFSLSDMVVVGVINDVHPEGVFNPQTLAQVFELTEFAKTLVWPDPKPIPGQPESLKGVIEVDMIAPSLLDSIEQAGLGSVKFDWLMPEPPATQEQALSIRDKAQKIPLLNGTLVSDDGKAIAIYLPLSDKHYSYQVKEALEEKITSWGSDHNNQFHITGLPVAEATFGIEMFYQMAISAPLAMLLIFLLLWFFFKKLSIVISPMIVAMVSSLTTMGVFIATGNTIHIMSSMIPIFIMPIAVLDSVHILSEFFDEYQKTRDRKSTLIKVMGHLFKPMLFTTLTTMAGFASLYFTPIPPVQVFGLFVALGVFLAWFWTITFIPAFIMFIPEKKLENFGYVSGDGSAENSLLSRVLKKTGRFSFQQRKLIILGTLVMLVVAVMGIKKININDNPTKWFEESHPIWVADRVLNEKFAGTYLTYLALESNAVAVSLDNYATGLMRKVIAEQKISGNGEAAQLAAINKKIVNAITQKVKVNVTPNELILFLDSYIEMQIEEAESADMDVWEQVQAVIDAEKQKVELFKDPEILNYIEGLQEYLKTISVVGKSNSLVDIVKTVYRELHLGNIEDFRIPDNRNAVAQTLISYQNSHRPHDLWHFVTPDYRKANIMLQLSSGDNQDMLIVEQAVKEYFENNPPPVELSYRWFGLTYINSVWQEKMVAGMANALAGSFIVVFIMMSFLFRSMLWGLLSMIPLTMSLGFIYGVIGLIGKDYDMPVAVLSALSLGLAIDYAIHFLSRSRQFYALHGNWPDTLNAVFAEPARAITRNAIIVGVGFLPLLAAPLVPYQTVGVLIASILISAGIASLLMLPALITMLQKYLWVSSK